MLKTNITYDDKGKSGIYCIKTIDLPHKEYIGSAKCLYQRFMNHRKDLKQNKHYNGKLQNYYNKYGVNSLIMNIIEFCEYKDLTKREQFYFDSRCPYFNLERNARSSFGYKHRPETLKKMSETRKGKIAWNLGKKHKQSTIEKIRIKAKIRGISEELRLASIKANTGRKHSKEHINKTIQKQRKLSDIQIYEIRDKLITGVKQIDLAKEYRVCQRTISRINLGLGYFKNVQGLF